MGKLAVLKTKENESNVEDYLNSIEEEQKRKDGFTLLGIMQRISGEKPKMWGTSMIGFGKKRYKSQATGREVDWFNIGFSPRKANFSLHLVLDINRYAGTLKKLGRHKTGKGCLYIDRLEDIDMKVLEKLILVASKSK